MNFNYDLLLEYLSRKEYGKYSDFKDYIRNLIYDDKDSNKTSNFITHVRRTLSALGHVEFLFDGNNKKEYMIADTVISILPNSTKGVLCGKRTNEILEDLENKCDSLNFDFTEEDNYKAPKAIFIDFKLDDYIKICQEDSSLLGEKIKIVTDFSKKLLSVYPNINDLIDYAPRYENVGDVKVYNITKHKFSDTAKKDNCACEKSYFGYNKYYIYKENSENTYYEVDKYTAILKQYENYKGNIFELENNQLHIRYIDGLPDLIDRALTLASGKNRGKGKVIDWINTGYRYSKAYDNINKELVELLEKKTGLKVEVNND